MISVALLFAITGLAADSGSWPQFRGPASNPIASDPPLADRWSTTENIEWSTSIPGRGWSSPIVTNGKVFVTAAVTEGVSKKPQVGTKFTEEFAGELMKQGVPMKDVITRVSERDLEMPNEVVLHYFLYCLDLKSGKLDWKKEFHAGHPPGGLTGQLAFHAQALERTVERDGRPFAIEYSLRCVFVAALECVHALRILEIEGEVYLSSSAPH